MFARQQESQSLTICAHGTTYLILLRVNCFLSFFLSFIVTLSFFCFSGPLFNLLGGLGFSLFLESYLRDSVLSYRVDQPTMLLFAFSTMALIYALLVVPLFHDYKLTRNAATAFGLVYATFLAAYVLVGEKFMLIPPL